MTSSPWVLGRHTVADRRPLAAAAGGLIRGIVLLGLGVSRSGSSPKAGLAVELIRMSGELGYRRKSGWLAVEVLSPSSGFPF